MYLIESASAQKHLYKIVLISYENNLYNFSKYYPEHYRANIY